jgi:hypothetical protein
MKELHRRTRAAFAALALVLLVLPGTAWAQQSGGELVFAVNREADMLDLHVGSSRYDLVPAAQIYDTYLFLTPEGEFLPGSPKRSPSTRTRPSTSCACARASPSTTARRWTPKRSSSTSTAS